MRILDTIDEAAISQLRAQNEFFWLDLTDPGADDVQHLGTLLGLHPLAIEDTTKFGQRAKLDTYGETALLVLQGGVESVPEDENDHPLEEVHCHLSGEFIVTVHGARFTDLQHVKTLLERSTAPKTERYYVYKIIDVVVDSFFPILSDLDEEINELEDAIISGAGRRELQETFRLKRLLLKLRRAVVPMRDLFARQAEEITDLAGLESDSHDYFRDIYDHLIRISDEIDGYHDMVSGCTDLYVSMIANRQGETSKQLAIIASIFLPLSFLTGFFGMNFDWSIAHVLTGPWSFFLLGIGSMAVSGGIMWWWFHHKGWTGNDE
ncbi:magnesium transporter CorA family protein [Microbacterium capsulatum]|uniref:Magnesium transporter CorA family protein n=1 Tax=Microbacterium capsulatum TaxID=3041921 RepID=A0ABU0XJN4_9MICO|nr:magnesium transporter CorA family protein [Microbacterium sp. ASV81]MDQ4213905.1 magnesium transporter CorA family protein [Microbacterium sp. ASV81]